MAEIEIDLDSWPRAAQFHWFRNYERPHFATTSRLDVAHLVARRENDDVSFYRACLFAVSCGLHAVPELLMRFRGEKVVQHDRIYLSMPVPKPAGGFNYAYVAPADDFATFDKTAKAVIADTAHQAELNPIGEARDAVAYLSCMPWMDYTSISNAMPHRYDCIPRVTWGKYVEQSCGWRMAMTLEVNHALVDGEHVGAFFTAVQEAMDKI